MDSNEFNNDEELLEQEPEETLQDEEFDTYEDYSQQVNNGQRNRFRDAYDSYQNYKNQSENTNINKVNRESNYQRHNKYKNKEVEDKNSDLSKELNKDKTGNNNVSSPKGNESLSKASSALNAANAAKNIATSDNKTEAAKDAAKTVAKEKVKQGLFEFLMAHPVVIAVIAGILAVMFLIFFVVLAASTLDNSSSSNIGIAGYPYYENDYGEYIRLRMSDGSTQNIRTDEYIAGVLAGEVGMFSDAPETLKAQAVAARTYALNRVGSSGSIGNSTNEQVYRLNESVLAPESAYMQASLATSGLILTKKQNGVDKIFSSQYDAFAAFEGCGGHEDDQNYYLCQQGLVIPKSWANSNGLTPGVVNSYRHAYHGQGMSQWGAYYMAKAQDKSFTNILNYFYPDATIMSLYRSSTGSLNGLTVNAQPTQSTTKLTESIDTFLASRGASLTDLNDLILNNVKKAGPGTGNGVAAAASTLLATMDTQFGVRLPYAWAGGQGLGYYNRQGAFQNYHINEYYGVNSHLGEAAYVGGSCYRANGKEYCYYGYDCAGFVTWAIHTAGININDRNTVDYTNLGDVVDVSRGAESSPGDILLSPAHHIMLVLGFDTSNNTYLVAEAQGADNGIVITTHTVSNLLNSHSDYKLHKMGSWYQANAVSDYETQFNNGRMDR